MRQSLRELRQKPFPCHRGGALLRCPEKVVVRRFSFNIDLSGKDGSTPAPPKQKRSAPPVADGYEMSDGLSEQRQALRAWPSFQRALSRLPDLLGTSEEWDNPHIAAEYVRIYQVSKEKVLEAAPGFAQEGKSETHCFFSPDGTKHLVSRLLERPQERVNEIRLRPNGELIRLYYENTQGPSQRLDDLFEQGLLDLQDDVGRFTRFPNYVMRFFLLLPEGECLKSTFRGVSYLDQESGRVLTEEAEEL